MSPCAVFIFYTNLNIFIALVPVTSMPTSLAHCGSCYPSVASVPPCEGQDSLLLPWAIMVKHLPAKVQFGHHSLKIVCYDNSRFIEDVNIAKGHVSCEIRSFVFWVGLNQNPGWPLCLGNEGKSLNLFYPWDLPKPLNTKTYHLTSVTQ